MEDANETVTAGAIDAANTKKPKPRKTRKVIPMAKSKSHHTSGKEAIAVDPETAKGVRKLRAKLELQTGDRVTMSAAIDYALAKAMK